MRIISQDGTIDIPYEQCVIQRFKEKIYFLNKNLTGVEQLVNDMEMASYSTEEKAKKAMEMLRDAYIGKPIVVSNREYTKDEIESILLGKYVLSIQEEPPRVETQYVGIFKFPQDEDVEV